MKLLLKLLFVCCFSSLSLALTPPSLFDVSWTDQGIFKRDLVTEWQAVTESLTDLPVYHLKLELSDDRTVVTGEQEVLFTNTTNRVLNDLVFRLYPNTLGSQLDVGRVEVNGVLSLKRLELSDSVLRIFLGRPLAPREQLVVKLSFVTTVGQSILGYGRLGRYDEVLSFAHGYPVLAAQQEGDWLTNYPSEEGDPVVTNAAYHLVEVKASAEQTVVASGTMIDMIQDADMQTLTFATGPSREFFLASFIGYQQVSLVAGETVIHAYYPFRYASSAEASLQYAADALSLFSELVAYPYRELDIVAAPMRASGIEFPGVFTLSNNLIANPRGHLESVIVHEAAHQWSYNLVGSDQVLEPWLDEALSQYLTLLYQRAFKADVVVEDYLGFWEAVWQDAPDEDQLIGLPVSDYSSASYGPIVYGRGLFFFKALEDLLGEELLKNALSRYYQDYAWQFASAKTFRGLLEEECACELSLFEDWVGP